MKLIRSPKRLYLIALPVALLPLLWVKMNFPASIGTILLYLMTFVLSTLIWKVQEGPRVWKIFSIAYLWILSAPGFSNMLNVPSKSVIAEISLVILLAFLSILGIYNFLVKKRPIFSDFYSYFITTRPLFSISFILLLIMRN
jgi:hypothetical protein